MPLAPRRKPDGELAEPALRESPADTAAPIGDRAPTPEEIYRLIQESAYLRAEARGFVPGVELQDWLDAENEVKQRLQSSLRP